MKDILELLLHPLNFVAFLLTVGAAIWLRLNDVASSIVLFIGFVIVVRAVGWVVRSKRARNASQHHKTVSGGGCNLDR